MVELRMLRQFGLLDWNAHLEVEEVLRVVLSFPLNERLKIVCVIVAKERLTSIGSIWIWNKVLVREVDERPLGVGFHGFAKSPDPGKAAISERFVVAISPPRLILEHEGLVAEWETTPLPGPGRIAIDRSAHAMKAEVAPGHGLR